MHRTPSGDRRQALRKEARELARMHGEGQAEPQGLQDLYLLDGSRPHVVLQ